MPSKDSHHILIIGAGFAGVRCALDILKQKRPTTKVTIVSKYDYFEYYPAMYRVVTGSSPLEACLRLEDIFKGKDINVIEDTIVQIDPHTKTAVGKDGAQYKGDSMVIAIGSEMNYFHIEGVEELSFNFKSIHQALRLRRRIMELFEQHKSLTLEESLVSYHFIIVGGGASGVELAGELALFTQRLAKKHGVPESLVTIDLVDAGDRILQTFSKEVSRKVTKRLRSLGVNIFSNRILVKNESWTVFLKDMKMGAKTVIWTAGVKNNVLYATLADVFQFDARGRVVVDEYLQAEGFDDVYVLGDNASTEHSGLAQTALHHGQVVAEVIKKRIRGKVPGPYKAKDIAYDVPVGPGWAVLVIKGMTFFGRIPWMMRHLIDLRFYWSVLPKRKALYEFFLGWRKRGKHICAE